MSNFENIEIDVRQNDVCTAVKTLHLFSEELDQRCSVKKVFLEIS